MAFFVQTYCSVCPGSVGPASIVADIVHGVEPRGVGAVDEFTISSGGDFVHVWLEEVFGFPDKTSFAGGYGARGNVDIQCGNYHVCGSLWFSTGEVWQFYTELTKAYDALAGEARFRSTEGNLEITVTFTRHGQVSLEGAYQEHDMNNTRLVFAIGCDQSYLHEPLAQMAQFVAKYGDNRGLRR